MEIYGVSKQVAACCCPLELEGNNTQRVIDISRLAQWHPSVRIPGARVFERMNPKQFEQCFEQWVQKLVNELGIPVIAIDGKNLRGSDDRESGSKALHLVSAWATEHRLVLARPQGGG